MFLRGGGFTGDRRAPVSAPARVDWAKFSHPEGSRWRIVRDSSGPFV